jgi:ferric-dicitrate binding protein FerR (iron transport regulator)
MAFETSAGYGLRLDRNSRVHTLDPTTVSLERGRIYFESRGVAAPQAPPFTIATRYGTVRHAGTRYAVDVTTAVLRVKVRDGAVRVETPAGRAAVNGGEQAAFDAGGRQLARGPLSPHDSSWQWVEALAPPLALDGRPLIEVLEDIARASGRRLEFADDDVRLACRGITLKGPFIDLPMGDRLYAVLATTGLEAVENGERIVIRRRVDRPSTSRDASR